MTTLIQAGNSDGIIGRCDAKCYNAQHEECTCICGGLNHGKGLERAMENMDQVKDKLVGVDVKTPHIQRELF